MSWASRKRAIYLGVIFLVGIGVLLYFIHPFIYTTPTCFDGKQNGIEEGIDCGGTCALVCLSDTQPPVVVWSRFFEVADGVYSAIALVRNPNVGSQTTYAPYVFKLRDEKGILIYERKGSIALPPTGDEVLVFEDKIITQERIPKGVFFEFGEGIQWEKTKEKRQYDFSTRNETAFVERGITKATAYVRNESLSDVFDIPVYVVLYNLSGNAIASSRTIIRSLLAKQETNVVFTWPSIIEGVVRTELFVQPFE